MAQLYPLDDSYRPLCLKYLSSGQSLGPQLVQSFEEFEKLSVWLPETCTTPPSVEVLPHGIPGHSEHFGLREALTAFCDRFFADHAGALLVSEIFARVGDPWPNLKKLPISWFSCESPPGHDDRRDRICVYLTGSDATPDNYDKLLRHASAYPSVLTLTSLSPSATIRSGQRLEPTSQEWSDLFTRAEHVLLGVCDEMSYVVMSRREQRTAKPRGGG